MPRRYRLHLLNLLRSKSAAIAPRHESCYVYINNDSMRDPDSEEDGQALQPPPRLYERLAQLSGYTWDQSIQPFHSVSEDKAC